MKRNSDFGFLLKQPSAWIPIAISLAALIFLAAYVAVFGVSQNTGGDERAPARLFQLLMVGQLPVIAWFAIRWLPKKPGSSVLVLAIQAAAWIIPILTVTWLESL